MALLSWEAFFEAMQQVTGQAKPLDDEQQQAVEHDYSCPLWLIAGPGTGKTHTLVWLTLKRILVDGISADRLFITTFTNKAATELRERLISEITRLVQAHIIDADDVNVEAMYVGTLHSLCIRILQEQRYEPTFRVRVLEDEIAQQFYIRRTRNPLLNIDDLSFWSFFGIRARGNPAFAPNKAERAENAAKLFNRLTENLVNIPALQNSGIDQFVLLAEAYENYIQQLTGDDDPRIDQSYLQKHFLEFLGSNAGINWLDSGFTVIVDEYQDTNFIQEQIYFALCGNGHDITVVGDDDQSIYRFRGATVQSLVAFDSACHYYLNVRPQRIDLNTNRRSHNGIVSWVNHYIRSNPSFQAFRAPGKEQLVTSPNNPTGDYPAVVFIAEDAHARSARAMCEVIQQLQRDNRLNDLSEIALLTFSTKQSSRAIGAYTTALTNAGIPFHNPRNRNAQNDNQLRALIGCLSLILDEQSAYQAGINLARELTAYITNCRADANALIQVHNELDTYIQRSQQAVRACEDRYLTRQGGREVSLSGLVYKLLSYPTFRDSMTNEQTGERFKVITQILASYEGLYYEGKLMLEGLAGQRHITTATLTNFYSVFVDGFHDRLDDPEDEEIAVVPGRVNVMTIHQSKGLEFEVVFVLRPDNKPFVGDTHTVETLLQPYIHRPSLPTNLIGNEASRVVQDIIRLFFVAYSRAKRLLVLTGASNDIIDWEIRDSNGQPIQRRQQLEALISRIR
jgi:DNA helicase-2/ATP-dependent DNA helicase PcrA